MDNIEKSYSSVKDKIENRNISEAIKLLENNCDIEGGYIYRDRLSQISTSYHYLVDYMLRGVNDVGRSEMIDSICLQLEEINNSLLRLHQSRTSSSEYYSSLRMRRHSGLQLKDLDEMVDRYKKLDAEKDLILSIGDDASIRIRDKFHLLRDYFNFVMIIHDRQDEYDYVVDKSVDPQLPFELQALSVGAITAGMAFMFHPRGFSALMDIYDRSSSQQLQARAMVGILLLLSLYHSEIRRDKDLMTRMEFWQESILENSRIKEIAKTIIRTRQTDKVSAKLRDELMPEIQKISPDIINKMKGDISGSEDFDLGNNPEWEEMLEKNGIADKLRELGELQQEGADIMMPAFANLKNFAFFNQLSSWFLPFSLEYMLLDADTNNYSEALDSLLSLGGNTCDSDKYSMAFALGKMPDNQRNMVLGQLEAQFEQMKEQIDEAKLKISQPEFSGEADRYVKDLYRFFKLNPKARQFRNPFDAKFDILAMPVVNDILSEADILAPIAEFYFRNEFYKDSFELFSVLSSYQAEAQKPELWEKMGYCYHVEGKFKEALSFYEKAELLKIPGEWLSRKLIIINKRLGNYKKALSYISGLLENNPEDISLLLQSADCKLKIHDADGAAIDCHHVVYISPDHPRALRLLADAELERGNFNKSLDIYLKVKEIKPQLINSFDMTVASFLVGNYSDSLSYLREMLKDEEDLWTSPKIAEAKELIVRHNGNIIDFDILLDNVK